MTIFQPVATSAITSLPDVEGAGLLYKAKVSSLDYNVGNLVQIQTVTTSTGTVTQYFNLTQGTVIPTANFVEADFDVVGGAAGSAVTVQLLDAFEIPTLVVGGVETAFTLADAVAAAGKSIPAGTGYVEIQMQRRVGTEFDYLLFTLGTDNPTFSPTQVGQPVQDIVLRNVAELSNGKFLGVPATVGSMIKLDCKFWTVDPN